MGGIGDFAFSQGDLMRRLRDIERQMEQDRAARRLEASTIGQGGLTVKGGSILVEDNGDIRITGGSLFVEDRGGIAVKDGGEIVGTYPAGQVAVRFGEFVTTDGEQTYGLWVTDESGIPIFDAYRVTPATGNPDGGSAVRLGTAPQPIDGVEAHAASVLIEGTSFVYLYSGSQSLTVDASGTKITAAGTASGANVHMTATGVLQLVGSARALKVDIEDLTVGTVDALLQLQPRRFRDKAQVDADPASAPFILGFVADEVHAAGLTDLVTYDEAGTPIAVAYDRVTAPLVALCQQQQAQIDALTARLDALL